MSKYILSVLSKELPLHVSKKHLKAMRMLVVDFEKRKEHPLTLNSQLVGVNPIAFTSKDANEVFEIFDLEQREVSKILDTIVDDKNQPVVNRSFFVTGNTLNIFMTWLFYCTANSKALSRREQEMMLITCIKLWLYRFFTSLVNNSYPYGANEATMQAAVNRLTQKSDIIKYGTWSSVIENQALKLIDKKSIHLKTIYDYRDDKKIFYLISDTQTRMRDKLKNIFITFKETKDVGDAVGSYGSTGEIEGVKVVLDQVSTFDIMINSLTMELGNVHSFIDDKLVQVIAGLFNNIRPDMLKHLLTKYSELAEVQNRSGDMDKMLVIKRKEYYEGTRILVSNIVQKSYRFCIKKKLNLRNKLEILNSVKNIYSSSRISDEELVKIKDSVTYFIEEYGNTKRQSTISSLRIAFILYIIAKTFKYL